MASSNAGLDLLADRLCSLGATTAPVARAAGEISEPELEFRKYLDEDDLPDIMDLIERELSEPYVIYTYRYFLREWPQLCFMCYAKGIPDQSKGLDNDGTVRSLAVGTVVCKQEPHRGGFSRGYIAMLTTRPGWRKRGIARRLAQMAIGQMIADGAAEIFLETEFDNAAALSFYASLGFIREKRLFAFYLNRKDAFRLTRSIPRQEEPQTRRLAPSQPDEEQYVTG